MPPASPTKKRRIVNLSAAPQSIYIPPDPSATIAGEAAKINPDTGRTIRLDPLAATEPLDAVLAERIVKVFEPTAHEYRDNRALLPVRNLILEPDPGSDIEEVTAMGLKFKTCKGRGDAANKTGQPNPETLFIGGKAVATPRLYHSVHQAFEYLNRLTDLLAIEKYLTADQRPMVQEYGHTLMQYRATNLERAKLGLEPLRGAAALNASASNNPYVKR